MTMAQVDEAHLLQCLLSVEALVSQCLSNNAKSRAFEGKCVCVCVYLCVCVHTHVHTFFCVCMDVYRSQNLYMMVLCVCV